ncbi:MAG: hypothetical protein CR975_01375 [Gammaproteobacteria bacterium]|nr:MAG: hypothetical protein CR975_01375 [Gammaproteobacteria bacterium]
MRNFKQGKFQQGVTLIELMIALALGVIVLLGVVSGMSALTSSNRTQINNNNLLETGNTALSYVAFQLRGALASPCDRFTEIENLQVNLPTLPAVSGGADTAIETADELGNLIQGLGISVNTTTVTVNGQNLNTDNITFFGTDNRLFDPSGAGSLQANEVYAITDCKRMDIDTGTSIEALRATYTPQIIAPLVASVISVDDNRLFVRSLFAGNRSRLMENVELMRVFFGVDTSGDGVVDTFKTASEVKSSERIISAEIYVLVRAEQSDFPSVGDYTVFLPNTSGSINGINDDSQVTFTDRIPRKVFTRSINFRNNTKVF